MGVGQLLFIIRISLTRDSLTGGEYELPEKACEAEFYYYARNKCWYYFGGNPQNDFRAGKCNQKKY